MNIISNTEWQYMIQINWKISYTCVNKKDIRASFINPSNTAHLTSLLTVMCNSNKHLLTYDPTKR